MMATELPDVPFDDPPIPAKTPAVPPKKAVNGGHDESFEGATPVTISKEVMPSAEHRPGAPVARRAEPITPTPRAATSSFVSRTLPHSLEAEEYLLSTIFIDAQAVLDRCVEEKFRAESFYDPRHGIVFSAFLDMRARNEPIEPATLAQFLRDRGQLDAIGGFAFITQVSGRVGTTAGAESYIRTVKEKATLREIIRAATSAVEDAYDYRGDLAELTENLRRRLDFAISGGSGGEFWPEPVSAYELCTNKPPEPPLLIAGVLYCGGTMLLSGPSKSHKTFSALDAAIAIAGGADWLGFPTEKSPVLYLNLELQDFATEDRIAKICSARGEQPPIDLHVWNLRGRTVTLDQLTVRLPKMIQKTGARVVCIDPHYKVSAVSDMEENSNDAQGKLLTLMEGLCCRNNAALILTHHFAKGDASAKNAIDRASGGGVFARWGDVMLTFTPHEEDDAMTVEMSLRNFKPVEPFVVRWEYPRWTRDKALDPTSLKNSKQRRAPNERHPPDHALRALGDRMLTYAEWLDASGMKESTFRRKREELMNARKVHIQSGLYRAVSS